MTLQKHNFLYFTALPPTIDKFSICAEPFHPSLVRPTATPRPRSDHLLHIPSAIHPSFQPLLNHDPTAPQPFPRHPATTLQPRHNHPSCRIQERFRLMEPRRIRRIHSLGLSLHRLTAAAHQSPLQAKCNLIRGKLRRARSNAPQRFEASSWASCRTTADASSFCESRAVRLRRNPSRFAPAAIHASARSATR